MSNLGRDEAEYADDVRCPTCNKWFRRNELNPLSKEEVKERLTGTWKLSWGHCPICQAKLYP